MAGRSRKAAQLQSVAVQKNVAGTSAKYQAMQSDGTAETLNDTPTSYLGLAEMQARSMVTWSSVGVGLFLVSLGLITSLVNGLYPAINTKVVNMTMVTDIPNLGYLPAVWRGEIYTHVGTIVVGLALLLNIVPYFFHAAYKHNKFYSVFIIDALLTAAVLLPWMQLSGLLNGFFILALFVGRLAVSGFFYIHDEINDPYMTLIFDAQTARMESNGGMEVPDSEFDNTTSESNPEAPAKPLADYVKWSPYLGAWVINVLYWVIIMTYSIGTMIKQGTAITNTQYFQITVFIAYVVLELINIVGHGLRYSPSEGDGSLQAVARRLPNWITWTNVRAGVLMGLFDILMILKSYGY